MRIGTWNLAGRWSDVHAEFLLGLDCDLLLLTEVDDRLDLAAYAVHRTGWVYAPRRRWSAIAARTTVAPLADPHPATALAEVAGCLVASSVLPWNACGSSGWGEGNTADRTVRAVDAVAERLHGRDVIWGGDWNHALTGRVRSGSKAGRVHLLHRLAELGLAVPTTELPHRIDGLFSIDHIAHPADRASSARRIDATGLSDHDAYVVELTWVRGGTPSRPAPDSLIDQLQPDVLPQPSHT